MDTTTNNLPPLASHTEENYIPAKVERIKNFSNYAFRKAGLNSGDPHSLKSFLKWIKDGYIVDEAYNEKEHQKHKDKIRSLILENNQEKGVLECERNKSQEVYLLAEEQKIKDYEDEIQQTKLDLEEKKIITGYSSIKFFTYVTLVILLSVYLILFYASALYASFFRNAGAIIETAGDDIVLYLDNIFDVKGIFTPSPVLLIVYLGAFLFFAIGLIPHTMEGRYKSLKVGLAIFGALIVDSLLAYKIDSGIHDLKVMAGIAEENWNFLTSINFYLVLAFGFLAYLVWGYMYDLMLREKDKKNAQIFAQLIIRDLKNKIKSQKEVINELRANIVKLESKIKNLQDKVEQLKKDLDRAVLNPDLLSQNLTSFYTGWRQFLNSSSEFDDKKGECEIVYNNFIDSHFKTTSSLN